MKILVNASHPKLKNYGGVANHLRGLEPYLPKNFHFNTIGKRFPKKGSGKYWLPWDVMKFTFKLVMLRPDFVWLNPSLNKNALRRDLVFLRLAHALGVKAAVFIHGFDARYYETCDKQWLSNNLNKATLIFVLASEFKKKLKDAGITTPIELTTTKVEDTLLRDFDIASRDGRQGDLLFLSRIERAKGVYETIKTFRILQKEIPDLKLNIVGAGSELENVRALVRKEHLSGVNVAGRLSGKALLEAYKAAKILLLPSFHGEGMPTVVLEGMAFGLVVISRPVGGLVDFFENGKMGQIDETLDPAKIADNVRPFLQHPDLAKKVAHYNHEYAKKHFLASSVVQKMEETFSKYL